MKYGGKVSDTQLVASSVLHNNDRMFGAQRGRMNSPFTGNEADHWSPAVNDKNQWLQVIQIRN